MRHPLLLLPPLLLWQASACTLTSDPFEPQVSDAALSPSAMDEDLPDPSVPGDDQDDAPVCSSSELGGCPLPVAGQCESDLDCESQVCASGSCAVASCNDGRENGSEAGVDCGGPCSETCSDCEGDACNPPAPTCDDGLINQGEADVDCGGPCSEPCGPGQRCARDGDCQEGLFCPDTTLECTSVSCADGFLNGAEREVDCGGGTCPGCPIGAPCGAAPDCDEGVCDPDGACAAPACDDGVQNGTEPSVDCGGTCQDCPEGDACSVAADCRSGVCEARNCGAGVERCCQTPACNDGVQNGNEPSIDCGNGACGLCPNGRPCAANAVCSSGFCQAGFCRVHPCTDNVLSGNESDVDCGGNDARCARCPRGDSCRINSDCASNICAGGICVDCEDGFQNGSETGVDCGGVCGACFGAACTDDDDCASAACEGGTCCGGAVVDCTRCARRLAEDVACEDNGAAANDCNAFLQCLANNLDDCETSTASECSDDEDDVCFYGQFGGENGAGVTLAESLLVDAGCQL